MLLGVDVGGTFTDAALHDGDALHTAKVPTTADQAEGVLAAIEAVLELSGGAAGEVEVFGHGMTVGTNALLEGRGARTALLATEGFTDVLDIGRQNRPHLYRLCAAKPPPLVDEELRFGVPERIGADGKVLRPLEDGEMERIASELASAGAEAVAICLLHSYRNPVHEQMLARRLREALPGCHVSASHEVLPQFREYERCSTTVIDAYLSPLLGRYLDRLVAAASERGLPEPVVMRSSGGVASAGEAARSGAWSVLSGPAGGAIGATMLAETSGDGNALGFDMGGTSCDVCVVEDGAVRRTDSRSVAGRVLQLPMVDVHTVGAGGGSIAWRDSGGALRVGPRSAGADPGPACYGRGGDRPTVTDANLMLGHLAADSALAGGVALDGQAAEAAIAGLAGALGLETLETAEGIVRVANQEMVRALRVVTVERGVDPRRFALMPFGGAGPMHAAGVAAELGIARILCPRASGVLSALGLLASERRRDTARTLLLPGSELSGARLAREVAELTKAAGAGLTGAEPEVFYDMRYRGQAFELAIPGAPEPDPAAIAEDFAAEHEARYGFRDAESEVELVNIRVAMAVPRRRPRLKPAAEGGLQRSRRPVRFEGQWLESDVLRGEPPAGLGAEGPCVFELPEATLVLPRGWRARVDPHGTIVAERADA